METDWRRIATEVRARRESLHLTQAEAAAKGGLSEPSWNVLENARGKRYKARTLRGVTIALDWPADAIERLGRGEDATSFEPAPPHPTTGAAARRQAELGVGAALLQELDRLRHRLDALEARVDALAALPAADEATIRRAVAAADDAGPPGSEAWIAEYRRTLDDLTTTGEAAGGGRNPSGVVVAADTGQPSARAGRRATRPSPTEAKGE